MILTDPQLSKTPLTAPKMFFSQVDRTVHAMRAALSPFPCLHSHCHYQ